MKQRGDIVVTLLMYAVVAVTIAGAGWAVYRHIEDKGYTRGMEECRAAAEAQRKKEAEQSNRASTGLEADREKTRVVYRTITRKVDRIVERPVYRNVCFDDDGVREANAALAGTSTARSQPDAAVPKPDAARGWFRGLRTPKAG